MKKLVVLVVMMAMVLSAACAEIYPETAKVVAVDYDADTVTVETFNGFQYTFEGAEDWMIGDCASMIMDDNGTEKVMDDSIVMAYYGGWELVNWERGE